MDLGGTALIIRRLVVPLTAAAMTFHAGQGFAQVPFPAPLPGQAAPVTGSALNGGTASPLQADPFQNCEYGFMSLREDAVQRGKLVKAADEGYAPAAKVCKLIENYGEAETRLIEYVESHGARCGIPPQMADQLKESHKSTDKMRRRVCAVAQRQKVPVGPVGDFWPAGARDGPRGLGR
jgi:hypothetical protein